MAFVAANPVVLRRLILIAIIVWTAPFFFFSLTTDVCSAWVVEDGGAIIRSRRHRLHRLQGGHTNKNQLATTARILLLFATDPVTNSEDNNDDDELINNARDLQQALRDGGSRIKKSYRKKKPILDAKSFAKLQAIAAMDEKSSTADDPTTANNNNNNNNSVDEEEGIYLDGDEYLRSSKNMRPDGSLSFGQQSSSRRSLPESLLQDLASLSAPDDYSTTGTTSSTTKGGDATLQDLVEVINNKDVSPQDPRQAEKLHRQVFEHEQAYLEQSKLFQQGLTNVTAAKEAQSTRRSARFREEQARDVQQLAQNLDEWQNVLQERQQQARRRRPPPPQQQQPPPQQQQPPPPPPPPVAAERPPPEPRPSPNRGNEDDNNAGESSPLSSKWVAVDDPTTGEQFYMNEDTGEMKWELE
jgi:hypothetical protein